MGNQRPSLGSGQLHRQGPPASYRGSPGPDSDPNPGPEREPDKHAGVLSPPLTALTSEVLPVVYAPFVSLKRLINYHQ